MFRRRNQLRWATGIAAGAVAAVVTYYAALTGHDRAAELAAKAGGPVPSDESLDVGDWQVQWIQ